MKVLIICTNSDLSGAPIHVLNLIVGLQKKVNFFLIFGDNNEVAKIARNKGFNVKVISNLKSKLLPKQDLIALFKISRCINSFNPDLIHVHSSKAGFIGRIVSIIFNIPVIFTVHGWGWRGFPPIHRKLIIFIEYILSKWPKQFFIFVANCVRDESSNYFNIPSEKFEVIYSGLDHIEAKEEIYDDEIKILMPARISNSKDHKSLIKAFDKVTFKSKLILCGDGTESNEFYRKVLIWAPKRYKDIVLMGPVINIENLLNNINIFALLSNFEALPLSIIEALRSKRAVLCTDLDGNKEIIINNYNGLIAKKNDVESILKCLNILRNKDTRNTLSQHGRLTFENKFSSQEMLSKIYNQYKILINKFN